MTSSSILQLVTYFVIILLITKPLGVFMAQVFDGKRTFLHPVLGWLETLIYRVSGVNREVEQRWTHYAGSVLAFSVAGVIFTYVLQRVQAYLPLNPQNFGTPVMTPDLAFNVAVSFVTNTNWQSYTPEQTLSYLVQMAALAVQNFLSAAAGIAIALGVVRGFARQQSTTIGNFWVDMTRSVVYLLLPLSIIGGLFLSSQGVIQNFRGYDKVKTVEGTEQIIAQGPVASQEAIKMIGTNGGGFMNGNSSHPFENPTPLTNFVQMLMIFAIPAGLTYTFGRMVADQRQGWTLFAAMSVLFIIGVIACTAAEQAGNPMFAKFGANAADGNMEGKETRFGIGTTALFATITTDASCGAINGVHDSFTPLGGLVPLFNMHLGEVIFGGVGAGLYGILLFAILAVFIAGLMVGRTPEYLGKKIEGKEVKMAMIAMIATSAVILIFSGASSVSHLAKDGYWNPPGALTANMTNNAAHGFSEILYAYSSAAANNGSAFAGLSANTPWYNLTLGISMLVGRFLIIIPMLAAAGNLAAKKKIPASSGTFPTHGGMFVALLVGTIVIVGALTFFPSLSLGPIVEHFLMQQGKVF